MRIGALEKLVGELFVSVGWISGWITMKYVFVLTISAVMLSGCASAPGVTSALSDREIAQFNDDITPAEERNKLIKSLSLIKLTHRKEALREIEKSQ